MSTLTKKSRLKPCLVAEKAEEKKRNKFSISTNKMNLVEKRAQKLGLCEDFINGRAGLLESRFIKGVEEG